MSEAASSEDTRCIVRMQSTGTRNFQNDPPVLSLPKPHSKFTPFSLVTLPGHSWLSLFALLVPVPLQMSGSLLLSQGFGFRCSLETQLAGLCVHRQYFRCLWLPRDVVPLWKWKCSSP